MENGYKWSWKVWKMHIKRSLKVVETSFSVLYAPGLLVSLMNQLPARNTGRKSSFLFVDVSYVDVCRPDTDDG